MWYELTDQDQIVKLGTLIENPLVANRIKSQKTRSNVSFINVYEDDTIVLEIRVSTMFLGCSAQLKGDPLLFESMIFLHYEGLDEKLNSFVNEFTEKQIKYITLAGARKGHKRLVGHIEEEIIEKFNYTVDINEFLVAL